MRWEKLQNVEGWLSAAGVLLVMGGLGIGFFEKEKVTRIEVPAVEKHNVIQSYKKVTIDISGEVMKPGVYVFDEGVRLNDVLVAGGGLSAKADRVWVEKNLNRALVVADGEKIYIPRIGEENINENVTNGKININSADAKSLEELPGIGEVAAGRIVEYRKTKGKFRAVEELKLVEGIGDKLFEKIKGEIEI